MQHSLPGRRVAIAGPWHWGVAEEVWRNGRRAYFANAGGVSPAPAPAKLPLRQPDDVTVHIVSRSATRRFSQSCARQFRDSLMFRNTDGGPIAW